MKLIPVSALSSWTHCPKQFYLSYILKEEEPPKDVMILGLIKHKLHETIAKNEKTLIINLQQGQHIASYFESTFKEYLRHIIIKHVHALRRVNIQPAAAYSNAQPLLDFEVKEKTNMVSKLLEKGVIGNSLWEQLTPKVKPEFKIESKNLRLNGRIDRLECYPTTLLPVELKSGKPPQEGVWNTHRIQAAAYAMMLEDHFDTNISQTAVHYLDHNSRRVLTMNPFMKDTVLETLSKVEACLEQRHIPKGCGHENCSACKRLSTL